VIVGEEVIPNLVRSPPAGESKMMVVTGRAETAWENLPGAEPERCRVVCVDLGRVDLRHSRFARRISLSFRLARGLPSTDDVAPVGGRLRQSALIRRDDRRGRRRRIRIGFYEGASSRRSVTEVQRSVGRPPFLNRVTHSRSRNCEQARRHNRHEPIHDPSVRPLQL